MRTCSPAIGLEGVSVAYRVPRERISSFKEYVLRRLIRPPEYEELRALDGVDFEIAPGEFHGLVGRNGVGKSTLLKVVARVLRPTAGRVVVRGTVAPLLELGAGFHPDMTGLENVFINSTILGHPQPLVRRHLDEVIEFSELAEFMHAPIRTYSSGMQARLGFAVATMFRPDILLLDEVLTVGDVPFQRKCLTRIREFKAQGTAIVLVSHSLELVAQHCSRATWIDHGKVMAEGDVAGVVEAYQSSMAG